MKMVYINQLGIGSVMGQEIYTKYNFCIPIESITKDITRLTNQLWKLIPMHENNENWEKQLRTVIIDIAGLNEIFSSNPLYLQLLSKLEGILIVKPNFDIYRKTVFECISLIQEAKNGLA